MSWKTLQVSKKNWNFRTSARFLTFVDVETMHQWADWGLKCINFVGTRQVFSWNSDLSHQANCLDVQFRGYQIDDYDHNLFQSSHRFSKIDKSTGSLSNMGYGPHITYLWNKLAIQIHKISLEDEIVPLKPSNVHTGLSLKTFPIFESQLCFGS